MRDKTKVLIVDNSLDFAEILSSYIEGLDDFFVVGISENGLDALSQIVEYHPQIILLDLIMPVMDGLEVLERISRMPPDIKPETIIISAVGKKEIVKRALDLGARHYFIKPFDMDILVSCLQQLS